MVSLIKKELLQFFGSLIAYMILVVFALISGLFLWFFEGNMNILSGGYASLSAFFDLAPWLYLFLIPAITMRLFSEEMRNGTMELLVTRPVPMHRLILAKLIAALVVVVMTMFLSIVYFISVYELGHPVGVMDVAATFGSYIGLFFLAMIFLSIGLFASSLTENQIVAFVIAVLVSFFFFSGFELLSDLVLSANGSSFLVSMGISSHYESVSRGLVDSRDLFYFLAVILFFLTLTGVSLQLKRTGFSVHFKKLSKVAMLFLVLISLASFRLFRIDFTAEKRYTLSEASIRVVKNLRQPLLAEIYLEGDIPPGFRRLKTAVEEKLLDIQQYGGSSIFVRKIDPYKEVPATERNDYFNRLLQQGITCTDLRIKTEQGITTKLVFPSMVLKYREKTCVINLLKNDPSLPAEENLNRSVERLEFELVNAILSLMRENPLQVAFLEGHGEADSIQVSDFTNTLSAWYKVRRVNCDRLSVLRDSLQVLIVANPLLAFPEHDKLILDQYLMKGGKIIWLIDPVKVSLDSLSEGMTTLAVPSDLNLKDLFYRYGVRLNNDLILDSECMQIRVNTAPAGASPHYSAASWYFSPLLHPLTSHPVGKNVAPVASEFISTIDTVGENPEIRKHILLSSSSFSAKSEAPLQVNLRMIDAAPSRDFFNKSGLVAGILLEGKFRSAFNNRIIDRKGLPADFGFMPESLPTKMALFSDGGLLTNKVNRSSAEPKTLPLGYDRVSKITWGNRDLFLNLVQYLSDDASLSELKNKSWQIRLLDKVKTREQNSFIPWLNLLVPLVLILTGGLVFTWFRKRRNEK